MLKGKINLTLMVGPAVPLPVPREVLDALTEITVTSSTTGQSGFQLTFTLSNRSPLHTLFLLSGGASPVPIIRVLIIVTLNGMPQVLMDGLMTQHKVEPGTQPGQSRLTVTGSDLSVAMDYVDYSGTPFPAMSAEAQVGAILAKYAMFGIVPMIIPSPSSDVPSPTEQVRSQRGKDLQHINMLAQEVGYTFYVDPGPAPGRSVAYWGPETRIGVPQPALNTNMDALTNVESLSFSYNSDQLVTPIIYLQIPSTGMTVTVPIPADNPLRPPLAAVPPMPKRFEPQCDTARMSAPQALMRGLAVAAKTADVVEGTGTLDVVRYGRVLKARGLVGVRGAGMAFDGLYFVKTITHSIKRGEYKQSFTLARNGLVSLTPVVTP